jgi:site-specific DNA-methyltransferase (adenine-specific)
MILNEDFLNSKMEPESVDLIITDPPYGIDFKKEKSNYNRSTKNVLDGYHDVSNDKYGQFSDDWVKLAYNCLKKDGSMYVFSGWNHLEEVLHALRVNKFHIQNQLIWQYNFGVYTKRRYVNSHYNIFFVTKRRTGHKFNREIFFSDGDKDKNGGSINYIDRESVWYLKREFWRGSYKAPTKLPRSLIEKILFYSSDIGDVVLDPFMGSGQVPYISNEYGRKYIGYEISPIIYDFALHRLLSGDYYGKDFII